MKINELDLNLLVVLDSLLTTGSVVRTADHICLSPSATSNALRRLREAFGDPLFEYDGRSLAPTPFALDLAPEVHGAVDLAKRLAAGRSAFDLATCDRSFIISVSEYTASVIMNPLVRFLSSTAPRMKIEFVPLPADLVGAMERRAMDFAVVPKLLDQSSLVGEEIWRDEMACIGWSGCRSDDPLTKDEFYGASHVVFRPRINRVSPKIVTRKQLDVKVDIVTSQYMLLPSLIVGTTRLAVMHRRLAVLLAESYPITVYDLSEPAPPAAIHLYWHPNWGKDPAREWLCSTIRDVAAQ